MKWQELEAIDLQPVRPLKEKVPFQQIVLDSRNHLYAYHITDDCKVVYYYLYSVFRLLEQSDNNLINVKNDNYFRKNN